VKKSHGVKQPPQKLRDLKDWHAVLAIGAMVLVFFRDILLQKAFFWEDFMYQYYPFRNFAAVSLSNGDLPLWNPYTFSGMPFQADIQTALFYVPNLLLTLFVTNGRLQLFWLEAMIILHYAIAGVCLYYLAKDLGARKLFALFGGVVYALSGFMIMQAIHETFVCQVAWLPLVILLFRRALIRRSAGYMIGAGLVLGHGVLAGSPQLTLYIFTLLFLYFCFELFASLKTDGARKSLVMVPIAAGTVLVAIALTAVQLLPTRELAPLSTRAEISFEQSAEGSVAWEQLLTLIAPKYFGTSGAQGSNFWMSGPYWQYWETCMYIGVAALVAVGAALRLIKKNRYLAFFSLIALFGLLYSFGDNFFLHPIFFRLVPGFDKFRVPARMIYLFIFGCSILSAFGLQELFEKLQSQPDRLKKGIISIAGAGIIVWLMAQSGAFQSARNPQQLPQIHAVAVSGATAGMVFLLIVAGILFLASRRTISASAAVGALFALQFIDVNIFGFDQNNGNVNPDDYYASKADIVSLLKEDGKAEYFRVNSRQGGSMILDRNQGMVDRIFMMEGYTPLGLQRLYPPSRNWDQTCDMLNAKYRIAVNQQKQSMGMIKASTYLPRAFMVYRAKIIRDENEERTFMAGNDFDPARMIVAEESPIRGSVSGEGGQTPTTDTAYTSEWSASITSYALNAISLNVSSPKDGYLVLSEIYYPGWNAYVDGVQQRIYRADWSLRAIPISAGNHRVEVRFEPESFRRGFWLTSGTLLVSAAVLAGSATMGRRRRARKIEQSPPPTG